MSLKTCIIAYRGLSRITWTNPSISIDERNEDLENQKLASSRVLELMKEYGDAGKGSRQIEFFFYADSIEKAHLLANKLRGLDYKLEVVNSASPNEQLLINGWTTPIQTNKKVLIDWAQHMSLLGNKYDCKFDGWGTYMEL